MRWFYLIAITVFALGCSSSSPSLRIATDSNPEIDISNYKTFSWVSDQPYIRGEAFLADSSRDRITNNIGRELVKKGYVFVSNHLEADFALSYTIGSRKDISGNSYPTYYRSGWTWGAAYWGGGGYYRPATYSSRTRYSGTNVKFKVYTEGQLAIDIFDVEAKQPVWHGTALTEITVKDRRDPKPLIDSAVTKILETFPVAKR